MELQKIINLPHFKQEHDITPFTLIDFTVGFDDYIYLLFANIPSGVEEEISPNTKYVAFILSVDWTSGVVENTTYHDLGYREPKYALLRPHKNGFLLLGTRCWYHSPEDMEQNAIFLSKDGSEQKRLCFGDGIENCMTTADGKIITSYFDEGIFGNYGWSDPLGSCGLIVWDENGSILWENQTYDIWDCYAMNLDVSDQLWFYYYGDFHLVCTDFSETDKIFDPELSGSDAFAVSENQKKILFAGGYQDNSFYIYPFEPSNALGEKTLATISFEGVPLELKEYHFCKSKLLFLGKDEVLYGHYFLGNQH